MPVTLERGSTLGRYQLLVEIGRGGMASVWVARHRMQPDKLVAVKAMLPALARDLEFRAMFLDEGQIAGSINHENVAAIYDVAEDRGVLYMAMEWVEGEALRAVIKEARSRGAIPTDLSARVVADAAAGLHAAHELRALDGQLRHLVHCDVSPHNILIGLDGSVKLVDFGVANAVGHVNELEDGRVRGKFGYMSPEQARGEKVDRRSDVFSLAIVLYELSTGSRLFQGGGPKETLELVQRGEIPSPRDIQPGYPAQLEAIIRKGLERNVDSRFQTAAEFRAALEKFLTDSGTVVPRAGVAGLLRRVLRERLTQRRGTIRETVARLDGARSLEESSSTAPAVSLELDGRTSTGTHGALSQPSWTPPTSHGAAFLPGASLPEPSLPPKRDGRTSKSKSKKKRGKAAVAATVLGGMAVGVGLIVTVIAATNSGATDRANASPAPVAATGNPDTASGAPKFTPKFTPKTSPGDSTETDAADHPQAVSLDSLAPARRPQPRRAHQPRRTQAQGTTSGATQPTTVLASSKDESHPAPQLPGRSELDSAIAKIVGPQEEKIILEDDPEESPSATLNGPPLNRGAALAALGTAAMKASTCRFQGDPTGTGRVDVTFDPDGRVSSVRIPAPFRSTRAGACIDEAFSGARIPKFRGDAVTLKRKFRIPDSN